MSSEQAGYFQDGEFVEISTHFIDTAASGDDLDAEARIALLEGMVQSGDTENYWDLLLATAIVLDAGAERALASRRGQMGGPTKDSHVSSHSSAHAPSLPSADVSSTITVGTEA